MRTPRALTAVTTNHTEHNGVVLGKIQSRVRLHSELSLLGWSGRTCSKEVVNTVEAPPTPLCPPLSGLVQPISVYYTAQARHAPASGLKTWRQASGWFCAKKLYGSAAAWVPTATWVRGGIDRHRGLGSPWVGLPGLITLPQCECHLATNGPGRWGREAGPTGRVCGEGRGCGSGELVATARVFTRGAIHGQASFLAAAAFICFPGFLHGISLMMDACLFLYGLDIRASCFVQEVVWNLCCDFFFLNFSPLDFYSKTTQA